MAEEGKKVGVNWRRKARQIRTIGLWVFTLLCLALFVMAIVIVFTNNTGGVYAFLGLILGICVGALVYKLLGERLGFNRTISDGAFLFTVCLIFFFSSWLAIAGAGRFVMLETPDKVSLHTIAIVVPYTQKISYITDFRGETVAAFQASENREVRWDVGARFELVADYDGVFNLVKRFGNKENWWAEVQKVFEQWVDQYIAANFTPEQKLPSKFAFNLDKQQEKELAELGFKLKDPIKAQNIRIVTI